MESDGWDEPTELVQRLRIIDRNKRIYDQKIKKGKREGKKATFVRTRNEGLIVRSSMHAGIEAVESVS